MSHASMPRANSICHIPLRVATRSVKSQRHFQQRRPVDPTVIDAAALSPGGGQNALAIGSNVRCRSTGSNNGLARQRLMNSGRTDARRECCRALCRTTCPGAIVNFASQCKTLGPANV
jgi:hypothetical protein